MTLQVFTARIDYPGPGRLDITRKSGNAAFAPSWEIILTAKRGLLPWPDYVVEYTAQMRRSYRETRAEWEALLGGQRVVLCCFCVAPAQCHRTILARILGETKAFDAKFFGEITEWDETVEEPVFARRSA
jgi:uncharacterized protein YeaO (DUF488 family)